MLLSFLERAIQRLPFSLEFCKLNMRVLLFAIKGISSFKKVSKKDFSSLNKLFMKILLRG